MAEEAAAPEVLPRWLPLESNPELLNSFLARMGVSGGQFHDVFGLDPELLAMVPQPCVALCLLFPSAKISKERRAEYKGKFVDSPETKGLFYLHQLPQFGNACGTIACVHSIANVSSLTLDESSPLRHFVDRTRGKTADEIGLALASEAPIHEASEESASSEHAQTETPDRDDAVDGHFITFVFVDGQLIELDGMMGGPIDHGATTIDDFIQDAAKIIREDFMARDPNNLNFNVTALCLD